MYTISQLNIAKNSEIHTLQIVKKLYESGAIIDCEFRNKSNHNKYFGKPLVRKVNGGYEMFCVTYPRVIAYYDWTTKQAIFSKRTKEVCSYLPICCDVETLKNKK